MVIIELNPDEQRHKLTHEDVKINKIRFYKKVLKAQKNI